LPVTGAVPTVVPPEVQVVGAVDWGPKTVKVIVPAGLAPPERPEEMLEVAMVLPAVPVAGPDAVRVVVALATTVSDIPEPQVEVDGLLFPSPL